MACHSAAHCLIGCGFFPWTLFYSRYIHIRLDVHMVQKKTFLDNNDIFNVYSIRNSAKKWIFSLDLYGIQYPFGIELSSLCGGSVFRTYLHLYQRYYASKKSRRLSSNAKLFQKMDLSRKVRPKSRNV